MTSEKKKMKKSLLTARSVSNSIATLPDDVRRGNYRRPRRGPLAPRQRPGSSGNRINSRPINVAASASFRIQCKTDADVKFVGRIRSRFRVFERIRFVPVVRMTARRRLQPISRSTNRIYRNSYPKSRNINLNKA